MISASIFENNIFDINMFNKKVKKLVIGMLRITNK